MAFIIDIILAYYLGKRQLAWKLTLWLGFKRGWWGTLVAIISFVVAIVAISAAEGVGQSASNHMSSELAIRGVINAWIHPIICPILALYFRRRAQRKDAVKEKNRSRL